MQVERLQNLKRRYCVTRRELLAIVFFTTYFKYYLIGKPFLVRTDHNALKWLMNFRNPEGQLARWIETLSSFDMKIQHRPGARHRNAAALSRAPCNQCGLTDNAQDCNAVFPGSKFPYITDVQNQDPDLRRIKDWIDMKNRPIYKEVAPLGYFTKSLWTQFGKPAYFRWDIVQKVY